MKRKICFIAQFPPPIHGLSKAVETLYKSNSLNENFDLERVDITNNRSFIRNMMLIKKSNADLFYMTISQTKGGNIRDLIILSFLKHYKKRCVIHLHGGYYRTLIENDLHTWQKNMNYILIKQLEGVIVLGKSLDYNFKNMIEDDKIFIVPNCVDDEFFSSEEEFAIKLEALEHEKVKHVLYLSNFIESKGYLEVLKLAEEEKKRCKIGGCKKFHFDFAGGFFQKEDKTKFLNSIKEKKLHDFVTYHGIVKGEKKKRLLQKSHIFMLLTRYPKEGQPISILEAMGNGLCIVTTNHAGIPDVVIDQVNGMIVNEKDNKLIYELILNLEKEDYIRIFKNNYIKIKSLYKEDVYIDKLNSIFKNML